MQYINNYIDNFLNKITMYRVVLYGLTFLLSLSILIGFTSYGGYNGINIIFSFLILCLSCGISNYLIAKLLDVQVNVESQWITAFILTLIVSPVASINDMFICALIGVGAMLSKYLLTIHKKHLFNPVAAVLVVVGLLGGGQGIWWIGNSLMVVPVAIVGFLILKKTKRFEMFTSFTFFALLSTSITAYLQEMVVMDSIKGSLISGPLIFFAAVMLTEPLTTPPDKKNQMIYGGIVGLLYGASFNFGSMYNTPELALVLGNLYAYIVSPKDRLKLILKQKINLTPDTYEFVWQSDKKLSYNAGQYLEWTLGHKRPDTRGNRRYFTISSSPTEEYIKLGIKTYPNPSSFKQKLVSLNPGDVIFASQLAGEFTMPVDTSKKMVWIAGGIGVTPFRSMAKYMVDKQEKRDTIFFFSNRTPDDIVYKDIWAGAQNFGLKLINVVNSIPEGQANLGYKTGFIDEKMIVTEVSDYKDRVFYISGPHGMVSAFETTLKRLGVPKSQIKVDFFPGFV